MPGVTERWTSAVYRNLPNIVSMLGVLPLSLLLLEDGFSYLPALIVYNNFMDDLDGILARELRLSSDFGARLDNVADAVSHILVSLVVGAHFGGIVLVFSAVAAVAILIRVVQRLDPSSIYGTGTPTNELMRHLLLLVVLQNLFDFDITPYLVAVFALNALTMLVPFPLPHLIRARTKSVVAISGVNVVLAAAWLIPEAAPLIAATFFGTYLYSFGVGSVSWARTAR
jgi:CDP-diacylglycerol--serine O-phosphatidyltransferase